MINTISENNIEIDEEIPVDKLLETMTEELKELFSIEDMHRILIKMSRENLLRLEMKEKGKVQSFTMVTNTKLTRTIEEFNK